jgi:dihydrodipicolinate synthase/N-acetylneuraminate lyase
LLTRDFDLLWRERLAKPKSSLEEKKSLIRATVEQAKDRIAVLAGAGGAATRDSLDRVLSSDDFISSTKEAMTLLGMPIGNCRKPARL